MTTTETITVTMDLELGEVYATFEEAYQDMIGSYSEIMPEDGQMLVLPNTSGFHSELPWAVWLVRPLVKDVKPWCRVCDRPADDCACALDPAGPLPSSACEEPNV
jgi:hypothetical protein